MSDPLADFEITDDDLAFVQEAYENRLLRTKHPYVFDLVKVLIRYPRGMSRIIALDAMRAQRKRLGLSIPRTFDNTVQGSMQHYCRDSDTFKKRAAPNEDALFAWPKGKNAGFWAVLPANARGWVASNMPLRVAHKLRPENQA